MAGAAKSEPPPEDGEAGPAKKKFAGKQLILFVVLPALLLLGGGGTAAVLLLAPKPAAEHAAAEGHGEDKDHKKKDKKGDKKADAHGKGKGEGAEAKHTIAEGEGVYFLTLPDMLINVSTADGRPAFLKLRLTLEAPDEETVYALEPELPRIMDQFQTFLRELRVDDLSGSAGTYRLRLELLRRVNIAAAPKQVNAVLIEEMLIQ